VFRSNELLRKSPEEVVQQQVNAYNARDIDAFLATFAPDAQLHEFPGKPLRTIHG
jgi:hypothetical protein